MCGHCALAAGRVHKALLASQLVAHLCWWWWCQLEREWVTGRELEMGNEREKGLVLVHLAVGMWYPSSDQGRIP